jgi:hypothetical protein
MKRPGRSFGAKTASWLIMVRRESMHSAVTTAIPDSSFQEPGEGLD